MNQVEVNNQVLSNLGSLGVALFLMIQIDLRRNLDNEQWNNLFAPKTLKGYIPSHARMKLET